MQAIVKPNASPGFDLRRVDMPAVGPRDVLIKVKYASICGTDLHIFNWDKWSQNRIKPPLIMGHEFTGVVEKVGEEVVYIREGDHVSAESHIICKACYQCRTGNAHVCSNVKILGVDTNGGFAEYVSVPDICVWKHGKHISWEAGCIMEPLGNAVHTTLQTEVAGKTVAVFGCGPAGLMAIAVAKAAGAAEIFASDVSDYRLKLAKKIGAKHVFNPKETDVAKEIKDQTNGLGAEVVLENSGNPSAVKSAFKALRDAGRISLFGLPSEPVALDLPNDIIFKGATVLGITGRRMYETWYKMAGLIKGGALDVSNIITHRIQFSDWRKGFDLMNSGNSGKIIMHVDGK
ncbi:MAG: L-threonine 3-dehydrogenase [Candidatus Diapherotrites archaeon]|uniref:L-threonine 3-dehydrogenase n=1 Tax=Candidatus Iainarchaeum sp. TaxID=3101447 RepID=A0A8T4LH22_9ARCH|nr:L-threonine 3-dehydrogenase [Candidatus Diapherotrites archaeon]